MIMGANGVKRIILIFCLMVLGCGIDHVYGMNEAVITNIKGDAQIIRNGQTQPANVNETFQKGDTLKTDDGAVVDISMNNMVGYRVLASSESTIVNTDESAMQVKINRGRIIANIEKLSKTSTFKVETPTAIASVRGTQFSGAVDFKMPDNPNTTFAVREGAINVLSVSTGETFTVNEGMALDVPHDILGPLNTRGAIGTELAALDQASSVRTCS